MILKLINDMSIVKFWNILSDRAMFNCDQHSPQTIELCIKFLRQHHFHPYISTCNNKKFLTLSISDFKQFQKSFQVFTEHKRYQGIDPMYQPLSDEDWNTIKDFFAFTLNFNHDNFVFDFIKKNRFLKHFKTSCYDTIMITYVLNCLLSGMKLAKKTYLQNKLPIEISPKKSKTITYKGLAHASCNNIQSIWIDSDTIMKSHMLKTASGYSLPLSFLSTLFHEVRHVTQSFFSLDRNIDKNKPTTAIYRTIRRLAYEADSKACDLLIYPTNFSAEIFDQHSNKICSYIVNKITTIPQFDRLSKEDKFAATLQFIHTETHKKAHQTLMDCYLSKSRIDVYNTLYNHVISLSPQIFNDLCDYIDEWKKSYVKQGLNIYITKTRTPTQENETKVLEGLYKQSFNLKLDLRPTIIFSKELSRNLGVYDLIYGAKNKTKKNQPYSLKYNGLNTQSASVRQLFEDEKYQEIFDIYNQLKKTNFFLPPIIPHHSEEETASAVTAAIIEMHNQGSPKQVLQRLGYFMDDIFDKLNWNKTLIGKYAKGIKINRQKER